MQIKKVKHMELAFNAKLPIVVDAHLIQEFVTNVKKELILLQMKKIKIMENAWHASLAALFAMA